MNSSQPASKNNPPQLRNAKDQFPFRIPKFIFIFLNRRPKLLYQKKSKSHFSLLCTKVDKKVHFHIIYYIKSGR